jgi:hypothetical protein
LFGTLGDNGVIYIKMRNTRYNPFVAGFTRKGEVGGDNLTREKTANLISDIINNYS